MAKQNEQDLIQDLETNKHKDKVTDNEEIPTLTYGHSEIKDNIDDIDKVDLSTMWNPIEPTDPIEDEMTIQPEVYDDNSKYFDLPYDIPTYE